MDVNLEVSDDGGPSSKGEGPISSDKTDTPQSGREKALDEDTQTRKELVEIANELKIKIGSRDNKATILQKIKDGPSKYAAKKVRTSAKMPKVPDDDPTSFNFGANVSSPETPEPPKRKRAGPPKQKELVIPEDMREALGGPYYKYQTTGKGRRPPIDPNLNYRRSNDAKEPEGDVDTTFNFGENIFNDLDVDDPLVPEPPDPNEGALFNDLDTNAPFGSGGGRKPPNKPPPPGGEELPDDDDLEKFFKRKQAQEFSRIKRDQQRERRREQLRASYDLKQRRQAIQSQRKIAEAQIEDVSGATTSDRIIRRLAAFDIGRSLGASGQLFAALSELLVFRPEEQAAEQAQRDIRAQARSQEATQLADLDQDILSEKLSKEQEKQRVDDILAEANSDLAGTKDLGERETIIKKAQAQIQSGLPPITASVVNPPTASSSATPPPVAGTAGPSFTMGGGTGTPPIPPGLPSPPGTPGAGGGGITGFTQALQTSTKALLGTDIALKVLQITSQEVSASIKEIGQVLSIDPTKSPAAAVSFTSNKVRTGATIAGGLAGAGVGFAVAGPMGALAGGALGAGGTAAITEPIVTAITTGNQILESFSERSIGFETLATRAQQDVLTLFRKLEADFAVDEITANFVAVRGELQRAVIDFQKFFIENFGDDITAMVRLLTLLLQAVDGGTSLIKAIIQQIPGGDTVILAWEAMKTILLNIKDTNQEAADHLKKWFGEDFDVGKEMESFFSGQEQFTKNNKPIFNLP